MLLPEETASPAAEAKFGRNLAIVSILWILLTVAIGALMVLVSPWMQGMF